MLVIQVDLVVLLLNKALVKSAVTRRSWLFCNCLRLHALGLELVLEIALFRDRILDGVQGVEAPVVEIHAH